jgi:hypothetical protein
MYGYIQNNVYNSPYDNSYAGYNTPNNYIQVPEKVSNQRVENYMPMSTPDSQHSNLFYNFPGKSPLNSYSNITEESINEYMENFKKLRQTGNKNESSSCKESPEKLNSISEFKLKEKSSFNNVPNGGNEPSLSLDLSCSNNINTNPSSEIKQSNNFLSKQKEYEPSTTSPFLINESEFGKKMASASLSYYFDFHSNNNKNFKLNLFDNFPYKFESTDKMKLFNDNEEENLIYNTAKIIDMKSESEDETFKYQNYFGPHRSSYFIMG